MAINMSFLNGAQPNTPVRRVMLLKLADVVPDKDQPRKTFDEEQIRNIGENIRERGVKLPIIVRPIQDQPGKYLIGDGELRYRASLMAGKEDIPAIIDEGFDAFDQVNLNEKRISLTPVDLAAFVARMASSGMKKRDIAKRLNVPETTISEYIALSKMPFFIREVYEAGRCTSRRTLYELTMLAEEYPERVHDWIKEGGDITRATVQELADRLRSTVDRQARGGEALPKKSAEATPTVEVAPSPIPPRTGGGKEEARQAQDTAPTIKPDPLMGEDPDQPNQPKVFVSVHERTAEIMLYRIPTGADRVVIRYESGEIEEVGIDTCILRAFEAGIPA